MFVLEQVEKGFSSTLLIVDTKSIATAAYVILISIKTYTKSAVECVFGSIEIERIMNYGLKPWSPRHKTI